MISFLAEDTPFVSRVILAGISLAYSTLILVVITESLTFSLMLSFTSLVSQGTGTAMRMEAARFHKEFQRCAPLQRELYGYTHAKLAQARQTAACIRFLPVEGRLARWLLMTGDRMGTNHFRLTQELLGNMLGVLRGAVTKAAGALQRRKLISYRRGKISILDGQGLEAAACRCYQIVRNIHS